MNTHSLRGSHPLIVIAAIAVILTCLLAIGVMTGIVPSPMNRGADKQELTSAPSTTTTTTRESRTVTRAPATEPRRLTSSAPKPAPATGATSSSTSETVAAAPPAPAACSNCGTVTSVRAVTQQGDASMVGPAAGALLGGLAGRQIGSGSGQTIATVVGAGVGAAAGTEVERRYKTSTHYVVGVRMSDGSHRSFNYASTPGLSAGDKVRVVNGSLQRD